MKAALLYGPGDVRVEQIVEPSVLAPGEVLLQVQMGSLCGTDLSQWKHPTMVPLTHRHPISGHLGPVVLGHEIVGIVIAKGPDVDHLRVGQRVVPGAGMWCGTCPRCREGRINICERYYVFGIHAHGGLAEYVVLPAKMCIVVPDHCPNDVAVMAQPLAVAFHALGRLTLHPQQTLALFGVGALGRMLLAALSGLPAAPRTIIAIDQDDEKLADASALGATHVINSRSCKRVQAVVAGSVDVAIDATGIPEICLQALTSVRRGGSVLVLGIPAQPVSLPVDQLVTGEKTVLTSNGHICGVDLPQALETLATSTLASRLKGPVIPLDALVEQGLGPLARFEVRGKVIITLS